MIKEYKNTVAYVKTITAFKDNKMKLVYNIKFYDEESDPALNKYAKKVYLNILSILNKNKRIVNIIEEIKGGDYHG